MSDLPNDLSFDFTELFALKKLALELFDEVNFYKAGTKRAEASLRQLLKEKMELQLQMDALLDDNNTKNIDNVETSPDNEKSVLLKNISTLEEIIKQQRGNLQEQQAQLQAAKRDLKNSEVQRFHLESQLSDSKSRLEIEANCRKKVSEQITTTTRVLQDIKSSQQTLSSSISTNELEVHEACRLNKQLLLRNEFLESALKTAEETINALRSKSLGTNLICSQCKKLEPVIISPMNSDSKLNDRIRFLENRCSKLQQELSNERKTYSDLLESLSTITAANEQLALAKESVEKELAKALASSTSAEQEN